MTTKKATRYEDFEAELLKRPGIRKEYEALKPKYDMMGSLIVKVGWVKFASGGCNPPPQM